MATPSNGPKAVSGGDIVPGGDMIAGGEFIRRHPRPKATDAPPREFDLPREVLYRNDPTP